MPRNYPDYEISIVDRINPCKEINRDKKEEKEMVNVKVGDIVKIKGIDNEFIVVQGKDWDNAYQLFNKDTLYYHYQKDSQIEEVTGNIVPDKYPFKKAYDLGDFHTPTNSFGRRLYDLIRRNPLNLFPMPMALDLFFPNLDKDDPNVIWVWPNYNSLSKGKNGRTRVKPGKFFRLYFPLATDQEIEKMVDLFKAEFKKKEFTFHSGTDAKSFLHAYTYGRSDDRNMDTTDEFKRLSDSCMRYDKDYFETPWHPVEAFASGDFKIYWAEDEKGLIAARVTAYEYGGEKVKNAFGEFTVKPKCREFGPIYAVSEDAVDFLVDQLDVDKDAIGQGNWEGARLKVLFDNGYVAPYLDQAASVDIDGDYLVISEYGSIDHDHEGRYEDDRQTCDFCEERASEVTYVSARDINVCDCCLERNFTLCDVSSEYYENDEIYSVRIDKGGNSAPRYEDWGEGAMQDCSFYCDDTEELFHIDHLVTTYDDRSICLGLVENGTYVIVDDEAYPSDMVNSDGTLKGEAA
jgi:hypothetical protein